MTGENRKVGRIGPSCPPAACPLELPTYARGRIFGRPVDWVRDHVAGDHVGRPRAECPVCAWAAGRCPCDCHTAPFVGPDARYCPSCGHTGTAAR